MSSAMVIHFAPTEHAQLIPYLAAIHASCITHDRAIADFLPPLSHEKLLSYWKECIAEVNAGKRHIFIAVNGTDEDGKPKGTNLMGVCMLCTPWSETGPFRATVEQLLVHKNFRKQGAAKALINAVESEALARGRTLLSLNVETQSPAEQLCTKLGYVKVGIIPRYSISPIRESRDATIFYKHLDE